ncbi:hypothetical protein BG015_009760 [Linnemannia schmuckeri]|uniref:Tail specific protease domain-containing protein n=1 Tax=Linnemannia schmuckeri TaxID=64567 RepID=A0A9P5S7Z5_9FUNG|nr:hypothetical protein BG015_009760 [Linnemannia schmuckeri]
MAHSSAVGRNDAPAFNYAYNRSSSSRSNGRRWGVGRRVVATVTLLSIINPLLVSHSSSQIGHPLIRGQEAGLSFGFGLLGAAAVPVIQPSTRSTNTMIVERQEETVPESPSTEVVEIDPCTVLSEVREPYISYGHVKRCYEHVPFNATEANTVVSTMTSLAKDFYIFLDSATTENLQKPFTSPPVDILAGFDRISRTEYEGDFRFQTDVDLLMNSLNDAHANYLAHCYRHYLFVQPFDLYAPVIDKVQTIRILRDESNNLLEDCQVLTIDGVNALDAIQTWIDINYGFSKDAGVRLNKALTSQSFDTGAKKWTYNQGQFTSRVTLPERETITYEISCPVSALHPQGKNSTIKAPWEVYRLISWKEFDSTESFLVNNCYREPETVPQEELVVVEDDDDDNDDDASGLRKRAERLKKARSRRRRQQQQKREQQESLYQAAVETPRHLTKVPRRPVIEKRQIQERQIQEPAIARLVSNGSSTSFYQLVKRPTIGVVVIPTHSVSLRTEAHVLEKGFAQLYEVGVRNVILDLTGNGGGYVNFAYDLVDWMFPQENETSVYLSDLRTSMPVKALAQKDLEWNDYNSYFNPTSYSDAVTGAILETNFFLQDKLLRRANRQLDYTTKVRMNHNLGAFERGMPWQHNADSIVVMTDGTCGSACGMSLNRLKNRHKVKSYAVGGRYGEDLSLFSFAGASVYSLEEILGDYAVLEVDPSMQELLYKGIYRVPVMEFFDDDDESGKPIEFRSELYKADFHLGYTPVTARRHEILWEIVANSHWAPEGQTGQDPSIE